MNQDLTLCEDPEGLDDPDGPDAGGYLGRRDGRHGRDVIVTSTSSDSHTWNLVFLQLVLEELGYRVTNLGACTPDDLIVTACLELRPVLVVVSTVNGHGHHDGPRVIRAIRGRSELATLPVVIGGKLDLAGGLDGSVPAALLEAGFDGVFQDGVALTEFCSFVGSLPTAGRRAVETVGV
ncbi:methylaspartate mutase sigma subunit [Streptacidiphilus sp. MAP12-20]|uniref:cobalamin B12-binding domain-containing protein n=1 Tax=Streptacidiphilus sp. MAP12-20 TaxID=3156299 RepID=UPI003519B278